MRSIKVLGFAVLYLIAFVSISEGQPLWLSQIKTIELLKTTRAEIEAKFEKPKSTEDPYNRIYTLSDARLDVEYSRGRCGEWENATWDVPVFVVTRLFIKLPKRITPRSIGLQLEKFKKFKVEDVTGAFSYENEIDGIYFTLGSDKKFDFISFHPPNKFDGIYCDSKKQTEDGV